MEVFDGLLRAALLVTALLALPVLCIATLAGTVVAVIQAATGVQEQTLSLLPKILAVGMTLVLFGTFGMRLCAGLFEGAVRSLPSIVHAQ